MPCGLRLVSFITIPTLTLRSDAGQIVQLIALGHSIQKTGYKNWPHSGERNKPSVVFLRLCCVGNAYIGLAHRDGGFAPIQEKALNTPISSLTAEIPRLHNAR